MLENYVAHLLREVFSDNRECQIEVVDYLQQGTNDCALCVLRNIEKCIELSNQLIENPLDESFLSLIPHWYDKREATSLRQEIIDLAKNIGTEEIITSNTNQFPTSKTKILKIKNIERLF